MATTLRVAVALLIFSVGLCFGNDEDFPALQQQLDVSEGNFDDVSASNFDDVSANNFDDISAINFDENADQDELEFSEDILRLQSNQTRRNPPCKQNKICSDKGGKCVLRSECPAQAICGHCSRRCVCCVSKCNLIPDSGNGPDVELVFYFDSASDQCRTFFYYGSGGNSNRFSTLAQCLFTCGYWSVRSESPVSSDVLRVVPKIDHSKCNDQYGQWKPRSELMSHSQATFYCSSNNLQLACPNDEFKFVDWIQGQALADDHWFAGKQGPAPNVNSYYWASNEEIRDVINGTNMWAPGHPTYPAIRSCVMAKDLLSNGVCETPRPFYCSPIIKT